MGKRRRSFSVTDVRIAVRLFPVPPSGYYAAVGVTSYEHP
jgi:hypothetical protein